MAQISDKREQIEKALSNVVTIAGVAIFVTIFSLVSAHALLDKLIFQNHVINAKVAASNQLAANVTASNKLSKAYESFNQSNVDLLGNQVTSKVNDNAKIILDALPSSYDYPALTSSIQALLSSQGVTIDSIGGTDQSSTGTGSSTSSSGLVAMPFTFSIDGPYQNIQNAVKVFEKSIRPFQFLTMNFSGNQSDVTLTVTAQTYYQPATSFKITTKQVQ